MRTLFTGTFVAASLLIGGVSAGPANATPTGGSQGVIYDQARAIPTKSGMNSRITLFTKRVTHLRVRINGGSSVRPSRFGKGCGRKSCQKWKLYAPRTKDSECYDLEINGRIATGAIQAGITVCEPFPTGRI